MHIDKIQVFKGGIKAKLPCILLHVSQPFAPVPVVEQWKEVRNILRVHELRARL
jgi:hypothetical protein